MKKHTNSNAGFTLLEMMVAMVVFLIVAGAAVSLYRRHVPLATAQQNQTSVNIALRNAAAQLQTDLGNAGAGYFQGGNIAALPVSISVVPGSGTCHTAGTQTYGQGCFDQLNIISIDPNVPPAHPDPNGNQIGGGCTNAQDMANSAILKIDPVGSTTPAQLASYFNAGDTVLIISSNGLTMDTVTLSKAAQVTGNAVDLQHNQNGGSGTNLNDLYSLTNSGSSTQNNNGKLGTNFCSTAWVLKISGITYKVDASNPADPVLTRIADNGTPATIADQVIGFRVGALASNPANPNCGFQWWYDNPCYDLTTVQAADVSIIARTDPSRGVVAGFANTFDNGNYKVEGVSVVVDPRNLSLNN